MINLLKKLVENESTENNPEKILKCLQIIEKEFSEDFLIAKYSFKKRPIVVLSNTKGKKVDFILAGHIDVVFGQKQNFKLVNKNNKLYGRGVFDMKGPLVASIMAIRDFLNIDQNNKLKIAIFITSDEEIDGLSTKYLLEKIGYKADFAILPDGGDNFSIVTHEKGFLQAQVQISGKSVHASRPWLGINSIESTIKIYKKIRESFITPKNENHWVSSVSLTELHAGESRNQIPSVTESVFDMRYVNEEDKNNFLTIVQKWPKTSYEIIAENGPLYTSEKNIYVQKLKKAIDKHTKKKTSFVRESATSDAVFFTEQNIPAVLFRPKGGCAHQEGEWVDKKSLFLFYRGKTARGRN